MRKSTDIRIWIQKQRQKKDIIYAELSGKIIGIVLDEYNQLGHGHAEIVYQRALAIAFKAAGLKFVEQLYVPVLFEGKTGHTEYYRASLSGIPSERHTFGRSAVGMTLPVGRDACR